MPFTELYSRILFPAIGISKSAVRQYKDKTEYLSPPNQLLLCFTEMIMEERGKVLKVCHNERF